MNRRLRFLLAASFLAVTISSAQDAPAQTPATMAGMLVQEFHARTKSPGLAVSVGRAGRLIWSEGFGYADIEQRVPVWPSITRFRIGSVSKPMTAVAVARLWESGKLDLDLPVQRYVPLFPNKAEGDITTRLLAGHLAGIRHYRAGEMYSSKRYPTVMEGLEIFKEDALLHPPASRYHYSSYGWNLISAVVESVSEREFLEYMEEEVFGPMGLRHTTPDHIDELIPNRSRYYVLKDGRTLNAPPVDNSYKWAGGGFLSTSEDLVRFGFAHLDPTLLKPETVRLLWTSQRTAEGVETGYGIGWRIAKDSQARAWVGHGGGSVGGSTDLRVYPDLEVVVAIISNLSGVRYGDLPERLAELFAP